MLLPRAPRSPPDLKRSSGKSVGSRGIVNLSGRGILVVVVARQLGLGNSFARLLCCPVRAERGRKKAPSAC